MSFLGKMVKNTAKGFVVTTATAAAVSGISHMLKMSDSKVLNILGVGIPMMTLLAADDPSISDLLFKDSKKKKSSKKKSKKESEDHFFSIFGEKGRQMNKAIAEETGSTEEEVNGVMSLFLPSFVGTIGEEEPEDAGALNKMFKKEAKEVEKKSPSLFNMAMKTIF